MRVWQCADMAVSGISAQQAAGMGTDFIMSYKAASMQARDDADADEPQVRRLLPCYVQRLKLANFRSWPALTLDLSAERARPVVFVGQNGVGKTNLLEALSCLAPGRGLRGASLGEMTRIGSTAPWAVHARLICDDVMLDIGTGLAPGNPDAESGAEALTGGRRLVRIDKNVASPAALAERLTVLWLTPSMDRLFVESASARRRYLDRIVLTFHSDHGRQITGYERAMRDRNRLLVEQGSRADAVWLSALEARMAEHAVAMAAARRETVRRLDRCLAESPAGPFPRARLAVDGWVEEHLAVMSALEAEDAFRDHLGRQRARDAAAGRTIDGVHRSDLLVEHREKTMPAHLCSTGEQKGLIIAITLAHARQVAGQTGRTPILLLDEIAAHLDPERRTALFEQILALGGQTFMTGTDRSSFEELAQTGDIFHVVDGAVRIYPLH